MEKKPLLLRKVIYQDSSQFCVRDTNTSLPLTTANRWVYITKPSSVFSQPLARSQLAVCASVMAFSYYKVQTLILTTEQHLWAC